MKNTYSEFYFNYGHISSCVTYCAIYGYKNIAEHSFSILIGSYLESRHKYHLLVDYDGFKVDMKMSRELHGDIYNSIKDVTCISLATKKIQEILNK